MVPFAGWEMPVQYEGVIAEHRAVRSDSGVFDVSHMGEIEVEGPTARNLLQSTLSNDIDRVAVGDAQYTLLTTEDGGIVDDLIAYRLDGHRYLLIVNASNREADFRWLQERELRGSDVRDVSDDYALLAVQGPRALDRLGLERGPAFTWSMGRARRRRGDGQPHRLHRARRASSWRAWPTTRSASGTPSSRAESFRAAWGRATRCGSRSATRCTATTSACSGMRFRRGSAGCARSRPSSPASSVCARSRRAGRSRSSSPFG